MGVKITPERRAEKNALERANYAYCRARGLCVGRVRRETESRAGQHLLRTVPRKSAGRMAPAHGGEPDAVPEAQGGRIVRDVRTGSGG